VLLRPLTNLDVPFGAGAGVCRVQYHSALKVSACATHPPPDTPTHTSCVSAWHSTAPQLYQYQRRLDQNHQAPARDPAAGSHLIPCKGRCKSKHLSRHAASTCRHKVDTSPLTCPSMRTPSMPSSPYRNCTTSPALFRTVPSYLQDNRARPKVSPTAAPSALWHKQQQSS
jgi:hypothetical protein